jgi:arginine/lysine/ornithine decarboxylase
MNTPIADFVKEYAEKNMSRMHMPGHKGKGFLGCEHLDITEVNGADSLYEAEGIIAESEANATKIFGTGRTVYSTEGSSQCIRAMLYLALQNWKMQMGRQVMYDKTNSRPVIVAARNVHKAFVYAAALLDFDIQWLWPGGEMNSLCSCQVSKELVEETLKVLRENGVVPAAVYLTSPDYLGQRQDIRAIAEVCHEFGTLLAVDNAHGSYLHFTEDSIHPIDLGADICSDSAHKTLPVLTGGAYLQISKNMSEEIRKSAKSAMALFGSTSPSYLTMISLDKCNEYLAENYRKELQEMVDKIKALKEELENLGWDVTLGEPLKMTIQMPEGLSGSEYSKHLRKYQVECEYADPDFIVFMFTTNNTEDDLHRIKEAFGKNKYTHVNNHKLVPAKCEKVLSIRDAVFAPHEEIPVTEALGRICASPAVSCPPAIPIVVSGEKIDENAINLFKYYGISNVDVVLEMC